MDLLTLQVEILVIELPDKYTELFVPCAMIERIYNKL